MCQSLELCQSPESGFEGLVQYPDLAPTDALSQMACIIGTEEAYNIINRDASSGFVLPEQPDDSFLMHTGSQVDVRSTYQHHHSIPFRMYSKVLELGRSQQGASGEAHGGYTFCGLLCW